MTPRAFRARPIILTFAAFYLPGFKGGGPIRTLANMVEQLGEEFDFRIVASDRDLGDAAAYAGVSADVWSPVGNASVFYRSPGAAGWRALLHSLKGTELDLIYLNSAFSTGAALVPLVCRRLRLLPEAPFLLAPRGEFSSGALAIKPLKKSLFLALAKVFNFYGNVAFQASTSYEASDIRRVLGEKEIWAARNLSVASDLGARSFRSDGGRDPDSRLRAVFLSRLSPIKNLLGALKILRQVSIPLTFDIYGTKEDKAYWEACEVAMSELPPHIEARYHRPLRPDEVEAVLARHDFLFFPTQGENYGHVIRESLSAGLAVLISDQTPWRNLAAKNVGADIPLEAPDQFVKWIEAFAALDPVQRANIRREARAFAEDPVAAEAAREANRRMLFSAIHRSRK